MGLNFCLEVALAAPRKYPEAQYYVVSVLWLAGFPVKQISRAVSRFGLFPMSEGSVEMVIKRENLMGRSRMLKSQRQAILDEMRSKRRDNNILGDAAFMVMN